MTMRRKIIMGLLAIGAVVGIGSGFVQMRHGHHHRAQRAAEICVDAALATALGPAPAPAAESNRYDRHIVKLCSDAARRRRPPGRTG
jgi:hypothetical protein